MPELGVGPAPHLLQPCLWRCLGAPAQLQESGTFVAKLQSEPQGLRAGAGWCKECGSEQQTVKANAGLQGTSRLQARCYIRGHKTNATYLLQSVCLLAPNWPEHRRPDSHLPLPTSSLQQPYQNAASDKAVNPLARDRAAPQGNV